MVIVMAFYPGSQGNDSLKLYRKSFKHTQFVTSREIFNRTLLKRSSSSREKKNRFELHVLIFHKMSHKKVSLGSRIVDVKNR